MNSDVLNREIRSNKFKCILSYINQRRLLLREATFVEVGEVGERRSGGAEERRKRDTIFINLTPNTYYLPPTTYHLLPTT